MKKMIITLILIIASISIFGCGANKDLTKDQNITSKAEVTLETKTETKEEVVNVYSNKSYYLSSNVDKYKAYSLLHPDFTLETVMTNVNIGLDNPFYTNTKVIQNPDNMLVLCNKYNSLPENYVPSDLVDLTSANVAVSGLKLRKDAAEAFDKLCAAAKTAGYKLLGASAYRSYDYQKSLYSNYAASDGVANADKYSARAGFSEHQTGLAIDVKNETVVYDKFGTTKEYLWAKDNIHKYGFIIRYLPTSIDITGYQSEEWHFRYVGVDTATAVYDLGITFDEYYARYLMN